MLELFKTSAEVLIEEDAHPPTTTTMAGGDSARMTHILSVFHLSRQKPMWEDMS